MKEVLSEAGIRFLVQDITSGMLPLKQFLKYRDTREEFIPLKEAGRVGLPCLVINRGEKILFELPEDLNELRDEEEITKEAVEIVQE